jgi:hypothetical protein
MNQVWRRGKYGGELGGPETPKKITGAFFVSLWFVYLAVSIMVTKGTIDAI